MDSCLEESLTFFSESRVIKTPDQNETDFTKSLHVLTQHVEEMFLENVIALCETSGRIDQILGNINSELAFYYFVLLLGLMTDLEFQHCLKTFKNPRKFLAQCLYYQTTAYHGFFLKVIIKYTFQKVSRNYGALWSLLSQRQ